VEMELKRSVKNATVWILVAQHVAIRAAPAVP